jgi:hypothetical protein
MRPAQVHILRGQGHGGQRRHLGIEGDHVEGIGGVQPVEHLPGRLPRLLQRLAVHGA